MYTYLQFRHILDNMGYKSWIFHEDTSFHSSVKASIQDDTFIRVIILAWISLFGPLRAKRFPLSAARKLLYIHLLYSSSSSSSSSYCGGSESGGGWGVKGPKAPLPPPPPLYFYFIFLVFFINLSVLECSYALRGVYKLIIQKNPYLNWHGPQSLIEFGVMFKHSLFTK